MQNLEISTVVQRNGNDISVIQIVVFQIGMTLSQIAIREVLSNISNSLLHIGNYNEQK